MTKLSEEFRKKMSSLKSAIFVASLVSLSGIGGFAQTQPAAPAAGQKPAAAAPLRLQTLDPATKADPFPPVNPKYFDAPTPSLQTVDEFLHELWGYDANRIWRVEAIQKTAAPNISKVVVFVSERTANAQLQNAAFFITPDGKHAIAGNGVISFGAKPFADLRELLAKRADGPSHGSASKKLELVEFSDLQCPHCKEAQGTMKQLEADYPAAHVVYQPFPLAAIHPYAFQAAAYGVCVAKQGNDAYFAYSQAVYDTQGGLTADSAEATLKAAVTKAGLDPAAIAACSAAPETRAAVEASIKLAEDAGVDQTPMLAINGRLIPLGGVSYEILKSIVDFAIAEESPRAGPVGLKLK